MSFRQVHQDVQATPEAYMTSSSHVSNTTHTHPHEYPPNADTRSMSTPKPNAINSEPMTIGVRLTAVAATLAPVLSAPGLAPVATPLHEKMQDPHFSQLMATWPEQLRRYAKRPQARRRGSQELSEQERWYWSEDTRMHTHEHAHTSR